MGNDKDQPAVRREKMRQEELRRNPAGSVHGGGLPDWVGGFSWKATGILILVLIVGLSSIEYIFDNSTNFGWLMI